MGKAKKTLATTLATMLSLTALIGATACDPAGTPGGTGAGGNESTTVINVGNFGGGIGRRWLDEAGKRFAALKVNEEYTPGKKGVSFEVTSTTGIKVTNLAQQGYAMMFTQGRYSQFFEEIQKGDVMDITDIVTAPLTEFGEEGTIEDKLDENYLFSLKGNDGKYYMLPHYQIQSAASYDVDLFVKNGLYLAKTGEGVEYECGLAGGTYYFTGKASEKTVGNDGIAGTDDDGMPTTLNELVAQCDYMKARKSINPFSTPGGHIDYANYLVEGIWTGLAGYEQRAAVASHKGTVDYVTGVDKTKEIWPGTEIYAPVIEKTTLVGDSTDGYKAINQAGRYYAFAFMELCYKQGWFYDRYKENNYSYKDAMRSFILNGLQNNPKIAAHVEGSYWYNEAEGYGLFNDYKILSGTGSSVKNIAHWHMPTSIGNDVVTGPENAREETQIDALPAYMVINGNLDDVSGNEGLIRACKEFFQFLSTEQELKAFTADCGVAKALYEYDIDDSVLSKLDPYQQTVMRLRANNRVVEQVGDNNTYRARSANFSYGGSGAGFTPDFIGGVKYMSVIEAYHKSDAAGEYKNAWDCFEVTGFSQSKWMAEIYVPEN